MNEREIFIAARQKDNAADRAAFLDEACAGDAELRQRVGTLLKEHDRLGNFMESPSPAATVALPLGECPGTVIGPYKLLQQIGEGGMGTVFMAEQTQPVKRKVALKVIKPGMDSRQVIARFEAERQALAMMDHVNIARVLDAGATETGRPYFVMELVHGVPITNYCDDNHLTPRQRLELFVPVCQAIQHAHQKGVIHRDVKPTNVMVTLYDGKPVPKVIDFGVAKATEQSLTERTLFTQYGTMVGTLEYMSPEQAEMSALGVDTRSDIYSLGVLLYELLTGSTPLSRKRVREAAYGEILRMIKEEEPPKPSTRLSDSGEALASISAQRHMEPAKLTKLVRGELDWIVMKTLEKDRNRRYESASGVADDVRRYLNDEPVQACPPSAGYRFKKLIRRHKGPVLAVAMVLIALVVGLVGMGWGLVQADQGRRLAERGERLAERREREAMAAAEAEAKAKQEAFGQQAKAEAAAEAERRAKEAAQKAEQAAQKSEQAARESEADTKAYSEFLVNDVLSIARPEGERGGLGIHVTVRQALEAAQQKISATFHDRPRAEAVARHDLGATFRLIGELQQAEPHLRRAVALRQQALGLDHEDTLRSQNSLAVLLVALGKFEEAIPLFEATLKLRKATNGPDHILNLQSIGNLAHAYWSTGKPDLALPLFEETLTRQKATLGLDHSDTLQGMNNLASGYQAIGKLDLALPLFAETLKLRKAKLGPDHPDTLTSMNNLASGYLDVGKPDLALPLFAETVELCKAKLGPDHPHTLTSMNNLAFGYLSAGKPVLALPLFVETLDLRKAKLGPDHPDTLTTMNNLASCYRDAGKLDLALPLFQQAAAGIEKLRFMHQDAVSIIGNLIACHEQLKQFDQAAEWRKKLDASKQ